jgi:hypothetical protein
MDSTKCIYNFARITSLIIEVDTPSNSWIDSTVISKVKTTKEQRVGAHSLTHNTSGVERRVGAPKWGLGQVTNGSIIHMDLHKPNNKLINV